MHRARAASSASGRPRAAPPCALMDLTVNVESWLPKEASLPALVSGKHVLAEGRRGTQADAKGVDRGVLHSPMFEFDM